MCACACVCVWVWVVTECVSLCVRARARAGYSCCACVRRRRARSRYLGYPPYTESSSFSWRRCHSVRVEIRNPPWRRRASSEVAVSWYAPPSRPGSGTIPVYTCTTVEAADGVWRAASTHYSTRAPYALRPTTEATFVSYNTVCAYTHAVAFLPSFNYFRPSLTIPTRFAKIKLTIPCYIKTLKHTSIATFFRVFPRLNPQDNQKLNNAKTCIPILAWLYV